MEERTAETIVDQMKMVRIGSASIESWDDKEILSDIQTISAALLTDAAKYQKRDNKAAALRIRKYLRTLETLGTEFKKKSAK